MNEALADADTENVYVHTPVLLEQTLHYLAPETEDAAFMIDSTLGEGGHSYAFLQRFPALHVHGLDADAEIQKRARRRLAVFGDRVSFYRGWFTDFYDNYPENLAKPDIILFDLGISVFHYECSGRGFSFRTDEPPDMRLDPSEGKTAGELVNALCAEELADIFFKFGDERYARRIANAVAESRHTSLFTSAKQLADCIYSAVPAGYRYGSIHPATKCFQALRIAVNKELERLDAVLEKAFAVLKPGGKMGVITFHSLEDRAVKNYFKALGKNCTCPSEVPICKCGGTAKAHVLTRKPVCPDAQEIARNAPSRSAKLRVVRKIGAD